MIGGSTHFHVRTPKNDSGVIEDQVFSNYMEALFAHQLAVLTLMNGERTSIEGRSIGRTTLKNGYVVTLVICFGCMEPKMKGETHGPVKDRKGSD